jgi:hypothetical protein
MTVVAIKPGATTQKTKPRTEQVRSARGKQNTGFARKAMARQRAAAIGIGTVGAVLTGLSLSHLAEGVFLVTHSSPVEAWSMAIGIDCGFIGLELANLLTVSEKTRKAVSRFATPGIIGTVIGSAIMNATAFASHADWLAMKAAGAAMGCAVPALIYAIMRVGAAMFVDCHNKA